MTDQPDLAALPPATCYRAHLVADEHLGILGAVWIADVERAANVRVAAPRCKCDFPAGACYDTHCRCFHHGYAAPLTFDADCPDCIANGVLCHVHRGAAPPSEDALAAAETKEPQSEAKVWRSEDADPLRDLLDAYAADHPNWLDPEDDGCDTSLALRAALATPTDTTAAEDYAAMHPDFECYCGDPDPGTDGVCRCCNGACWHIEDACRGEHGHATPTDTEAGR